MSEENDDAVSWETDEEGRPYLDLREPIHRKGGEDVERLTFHELKVGALRVLDKIDGKIAQGIYLVAKCAQVPTAVVDAMDARDFTAAQEIVASFFGVALGDDEES